MVKIAAIFNTWYISSFGAAVSFAIMTLMFKRLFVIGIKPLVLNLYMFGMCFVGFIVWNISIKSDIRIGLSTTALLLLAAVFAIAGNYLDVNAVSLAPNPGYASTIKATQIVIISVIAPIVFKSPLTTYSFLGIFLVLIGIYLLSK